MSYGAGDPETNVGSVRQPFPDVTLGLTMIWFLTDVDEDSGATFVVPGSHRDLRNPRGPNDGICVTSPVSGDMQVTAKAGSVLIQDSRLWHASPMHNTCGSPCFVLFINMLLGIVLACLGLGICWLGPAYSIYYIC